LLSLVFLDFLAPLKSPCPVSSEIWSYSGKREDVSRSWNKNILTFSQA